MSVKAIARQCCPPQLWRLAAAVKRRVVAHDATPLSASVVSPHEQDLAIYWDEEWAKVLEHWGDGNAWSEIQHLMVNCRGKVLDIACGTGRTMSILDRFPHIEITGCDISDMLIGKARERGIDSRRLVITDATAMRFPDNAFDHAYSIGSLEHFTEDGIAKVIDECWRVTTGSSFHMVPIARDGHNHGWIKTSQSYFNNTVDWWLEKFRARYATVHVLDSSWNDSISIGKWFACVKSDPPVR